MWQCQTFFILLIFKSYANIVFPLMHQCTDCGESLYIYMNQIYYYLTTTTGSQKCNNVLFHT